MTVSGVDGTATAPHDDVDEVRKTISSPPPGRPRRSHTLRTAGCAGLSNRASARLCGMSGEFTQPSRRFLDNPVVAAKPITLNKWEQIYECAIFGETWTRSSAKVSSHHGGPSSLSRLTQLDNSDSNEIFRGAYWGVVVVVDANVSKKAKTAQANIVVVWAINFKSENRFDL